MTSASTVASAARCVVRPRPGADTRCYITRRRRSSPNATTRPVASSIIDAGSGVADGVPSLGNRMFACSFALSGPAGGVGTNGAGAGAFCSLNGAVGLGPVAIVGTVDPPPAGGNPAAGSPAAGGTTVVVVPPGVGVAGGAGAGAGSAAGNGLSSSALA